MFGSSQNRLRRVFPALLVVGLLFSGQIPMTGRFALPADAVAGSASKSGISHSGHAIAINVHGLQTLMQMDPHLCLVDVRSTDALNGPLGHIKRALNVPLKTVEKNPRQFPAGKTVVFISGAGPRSRAAARAVAAHGGVAYWVKGGMQAWHRISGQKVYQGPVRKRIAPPAPAISQPGKRGVPQQENPGSEEKEEEDMGC